MIATETLAKPARKPLPDEAPHILVVDDDRRLRELLGRFLGDNGYRVTTAANAAEADIRLGNLVFDAIVLDVMMPGENGFEFARRFRSGSAVPILMLTARADGKDRINGLEIGVGEVEVGGAGRHALQPGDRTADHGDAGAGHGRCGDGEARGHARLSAGAHRA